MIPGIYDPLVEFLLWAVGILCSVMLASMWMLYLIKLVVNEDDAAEKVRQYYRVAEELLRKEN